jgi:osmotically-inducible protein OsmY
MPFAEAKGAAAPPPAQGTRRAAFVRRVYSMETDMIRISRSLATVLAAAFLGISACATDTDTSTSRRGAGEFTSDAALTAKVKAAIAHEVGVNTAANINVQSYKGEVQLSGFVASADQASRAVQAANGVSGVRTVQNDVRVK